MSSKLNKLEKEAPQQTELKPQEPASQPTEQKPQELAPQKTDQKPQEPAENIEKKEINTKQEDEISKQNVVNSQQLS